MKNTKESAVLRFMIYPSGKGTYTAVCFELALIREGKDVLQLQKRISTLARQYVENIQKNKLSDNLLNQTLPAKYCKKYEQVKKAKEEYEHFKKWQKAFEALIWENRQKHGRLLTTV